MSPAANRLWRAVLGVLIALDVMGATLLFGTDGETISQVAGEARDAGRAWGAAACLALEVIEADHCTRVIDRATRLRDAP